MGNQTNRGAQLLVEWRKREGLTQWAASNRLSIRQRYLSRYENGQKPSGAFRTRIARGTEGYVYSDSWEEPPLSEVVKHVQ